MQEYTIESLTILKDKVEKMTSANDMCESDCLDAVAFIKDIYNSIERNSSRYGADTIKMQNICLMIEFFLETRISVILEYKSSFNS